MCGAELGRESKPSRDRLLVVPSDPADLGVLEAAELLRAGRLSATELLEASLARIEERNGGPPSFDGGPDQVNAWARLYPELAHEHAAAADARLSREGAGAPLLCGVPLALKDLYAVAGMPLTASSLVLEGNVAEADSALWRRLREHGLVPVGHTHTHEFAAGGTTDQVGNPWALDRVVGGSSGGNAAALAAGMVPAAVGTDTCGSLRIPSTCCGTSAIKPTYGRLPIEGIIPLAPSLDHPGPMARSVADCSALLAAMAGEPFPRSPAARVPARSRACGSPSAIVRARSSRGGGGRRRSSARSRAARTWARTVVELPEPGRARVGVPEPAAAERGVGLPRSGSALATSSTGRRSPSSSRRPPPSPMPRPTSARDGGGLG